MRLFHSRGGAQVQPRYLIVGLGNPGAEYALTRHNVGFRVIETLASRHRIHAGRHERRALTGRGAIHGTPVAMARPLTFMNLSGESVGPLLGHFQLTPADLIVIADDIHLPVGRLRIRTGGSAGGHNGLKSLIHTLRTDQFARLRIGVGQPDGSQVDHVLGKFTRDELEPIAEAIERAADAVELAVAAGLDAAMQRYNPSPTPAPAPSARTQGKATDRAAESDPRAAPGAAPSADVDADAGSVRSRDVPEPQP